MPDEPVKAEPHKEDPKPSETMTPVPGSAPKEGEKPVEAPKPEGDKQDTVSKSFLKLGRRVQAFEKQQTEARAALSSREAQIAARETRLSELEQRSKTLDEIDGYFQKKDYVGLMNAKGIPYSDVAKQVINNGNRDPVDVMREELARSETKIIGELERRKVDEEKKAQADLEARTIQTAKGYIGQLLRDHPDKWDLAARVETPDSIYKLMDDTYRLTGGKKLLTYEQALDEREKALEEKLSQSQKLKARFQPSPEPVVPTRQPSQTLSTRKPVTEPSVETNPPKLTNEQLARQIAERARANLVR